MTPDRVHSIRKALGLSQAGLGRLIGMKGQNPDRNIRDWEGGETAVPGPSAGLLEYIAQGLPATVQALGLPKHVLTCEQDGSGADRLLIRLWRPRFVMNARTTEILMWIDQPDDGERAREVFAEAGAFLTDVNLSR